MCNCKKELSDFETIENYILNDCSCNECENISEIINVNIENAFIFKHKVMTVSNLQLNPKMIIKIKIVHFIINLLKKI